MRKTILKIAALAVTVSTVLSTVSCSSGTEGYILDGDKKVVPEYIMKVDGNEVSFDEYRFNYLNVKGSYDGGDDTYWTDNTELAEKVKTDTEDHIKNTYAVQKLAKENGVELTSDDEKAVDDQISKAIEVNGKDEYLEQLKQNFWTEDLYRDSLLKVSLLNKLYDYYFKAPGEYAWSDSEYRDYMNENYYCVMYIQISYVSGEGTIVYDETSAKADEVYEKAAAGEDFRSLILEYGDDADMEKYENGCYICDSDKSEQFMTTVKSLDEGMISKPLQTPSGYYIIKRLPFNDDDVSSIKDSVLFGDDANTGVYEQKFSEIYSAEARSLTVEYCDEYNLITPTTIK